MKDQNVRLIGNASSRSLTWKSGPRRLLLGATLIGSAVAPAMADAQWTTRASIPTAMSQAAIVADATDKIHAIGGYSSGGELNTHHVYDPALDAWTTAPTLPVNARGCGSALGPDGRIYVFGGYGQIAATALYIYDPVLSSWSAGPPMPLGAGWETEGEFGADGRLYVFGGESAPTSLQIFDPSTSSWTAGASLPSSRKQHGVFFGSDGRFYVVGGCINSSCGSDSTSAYDPVSDSWSAGPNVPSGINSFGDACRPDGSECFVVGGGTSYTNDSSPYSSAVFVLDVSSQSWTSAPSLPTARRELGAAVAAGRLFAIGGSNGSKLATNQAFSIECGDGELDAGEACDDGGIVDGDCCSADCQTVAAASTPCAADGNECTDDVCDGLGSCGVANSDPCDDGLYCTQNDTCGGGTCSGSPRSCTASSACSTGICDEDSDACVQAEVPREPASCLLALKAKLQIADSATAGKDKLSWQWSSGEAFDQDTLGTPLVDTTYTVCIYDETSSVPSLAASIDIAASPTLWASKDPKGFQYKDKGGTSEGVTKAQLKTGLDGKTKAKVSASGLNLVLPSPAGATFFHQNPRVLVQLVNSAGTCWTSEFDAADTKTNGADRFKAQVK